MTLILIKRLVISLIAVLQVQALILIAFGIYFLSTGKWGETYHGSFFIILGSITMILAIFGFIAAIRKALVSFLTYLGGLAPMIRIQVGIINLASAREYEIKRKIRQISDSVHIFEPDHRAISNLEMLMQLWGLIKIVCWLIVLLEVVGAVFVVLLYRSVKRSRLAENPVPSS